MKREFSDVSVDVSQTNSDAVRELEKLGITYKTTDKKEIIQNYRQGKRVLKVTPKMGETMDTCATISDKYICCNVKVLKSVSNCPYDCSYCFLQNYLNDGTTSVIGDNDALVEEVKENSNKEPWRLLRVGTWELGDSLALEEESGQARALIPRFANLNNVLLELKTKSDCVDSILELDHQEKTVISWSLNSQKIIDEQEHRTASLEKRLIAMKKVLDAGYLIGLHFDPMIYYKGWEAGYTDLLKRVFETVTPDRIAWISVGSLRFNPEMKKKMEENFPASTLTAEELVKGDDGKLRYVKPLRYQMYDLFFDNLKKGLGSDDISPLTANHKNKPLIYYCMERWDVWEHTFGASPESIGDLDYLFAKNIHDRFPHLHTKLAEKPHYLIPS
jgi:spore photoproduct lyase